MVYKAVEAFFKKQPSKAVHPDEAVALGAAILADTIAGNKEQEIMLLDVLPITIGIKLGGDRVSTIFERNSPVPSQKQKIYSTSKDEQEAIILHLLQGDSPIASECVPIGEFSFAGLKKAPKGEVSLEVNFNISPEGILSVTARDPVTGTEQKSTINIQSTHTKVYHKDLVEPKKPVEASASSSETIITRTVTREKKLKAGEMSKPDMKAEVAAAVAKADAAEKLQAQKQETKDKPKPTEVKPAPTPVKPATPKPAAPKPSPRPPKPVPKKGFFAKIFSIFSRSE